MTAAKEVQGSMTPHQRGGEFFETYVILSLTHKQSNLVAKFDRLTHHGRSRRTISTHRSLYPIPTETRSKA